MRALYGFWNFVQLFFLLILGSGNLFSQNIAVNTTGAAAAALNMFEVTQTDNTSNSVGIFSKNTGTGTNAYAIWAEATGATNKYAMVVPAGGGYVGIGTTTPVTPLHIITTTERNQINERVTSAMAALGGIVINRRARGTIGALTAVLSGDELGKYMFSGYDGSNYLITAQIDAVANGAIAAGSIPTDITFSTGSTDLGYTEKMRILSGGNVGLGTTDPLTKLHVGSKVIDDNGYSFDANSLYIIHQTPTSTATLNDPKTILFLARQGTSGQAYGAAATFNLSRFENNSTNSRTRLDISLAHTAFDATSNNIMTLLSSGNVGIGITTPGTKLEISGSEANNQVGAGSSAALKLVNTNATTGGRLSELQFGYSSTTKFAAISGAISDASSNTRGDILFSTRNLPGDANLTERMRIDGAGNVGIGIAVPAARLHVVGNNVVDGTIYARNGTTTANYGRILHSGAGGNFHLDTYGTGGLFLNYFSGTNTHIGNGASGYVASFLASGDVGIGATNPGAKLHVAAATTGRQLIVGAWAWADISSNQAGRGIFGGNMYTDHSPSAFKYSETHASIGGMAFAVNYPSWNQASVITSGTTSSTAGTAFAPVTVITFDYTGKVGIGCTAPQYPLHVVGNMGVVGTIYATAASVTSGVLACSDIRYKRNITPLPNALNSIMQLEGVNYFWKTKEFADKQFTATKQIGFIAQEVEKIFPELVFTDKDGYKSVDYSRLTPVLVEAIKEMKKELDQYRLELKTLKAIVENNAVEKTTAKAKK